VTYAKNIGSIAGVKNKSQLKLNFDAKKEGQVGERSVGNNVIAKCNVRKIRIAIAKMIIVDEFPFKFVEGEGFQVFMKIIESVFQIHSRYTVIKGLYFKLFLFENAKLRAMFLTTSARICLTTNT
jgi:hypothetical protein